MSTTTSETCFVCGYKTLEERCDWEICPVCGWEDDVLVVNDVDKRSSANKGMLVSEAQLNFIRFGASSESRKDRVRAPIAEEKKDPEWQPLSSVAELVKRKG